MFLTDQHVFGGAPQVMCTLVAYCGRVRIAQTRFVALAHAQQAKRRMLQMLIRLSIAAPTATQLQYSKAMLRCRLSWKRASRTFRCLTRICLIKP